GRSEAAVEQAGTVGLERAGDVPKRDLPDATARDCARPRRLRPLEACQLPGPAWLAPERPHDRRAPPRPRHPRERPLGIDVVRTRHQHGIDGGLRPARAHREDGIDLPPVPLTLAMTKPTKS